MTRFKIVEGSMVEDPEGPFVFFVEHQTIVTTLETQIHAIAKYIEAVQTYVDSIK